ncbi:MAG: DUF971 domain-containing protein [Candidatus Pacebacteria bacterium]|nr:DUF971 domain-containing protein [Candidatus Paceibacterota bacterium]
MMAVNAPPHPTEIRLSEDHHSLVVVFNSGETFTLSAEYLRVESPSAEVRGHSPSERKILGGCRQVTINRLEPVGHYALRILFSDGHDTGLYSWAYLYELGHDFDRIWAAYLTALASKGLSRD